MKLILTSILTLSFTVLFSQGSFIAKYYPSSSNTVADGGLKVEYLNHSNPVIYSIELGTVINPPRFMNPQNLLFDVGIDTSSVPFSDSIIYGDSVSNILISETAQANGVARSYGAFRASAIDAITLDTLAIIKSKGYENEIKFNYIQAYSYNNQTEGSFSIDTNNYTTSNGVYDTIYNSLASGPSSFEFMFPMLDFNNETNTTLLPDFLVNNLPPDHYEFGSSLGYSISFVITDTTALVNSFPISVITTADSLNCNGTAYASVSSTSGPFTYSWDGTPYINDSTINNLCAGSHTITVKDINGDSTQNIFYIDNSMNSFSVSVITTLDSLNCNGTASASVSSTSYPFTYSWDASSYVNDSILTGLCVGAHSLTVRDANGILASVQFYIDSALGASSFPNVNITTTLDSSNCNGTAYASVSSIAGPFTYSWDANSYINDSVINGLCAGSHTLTVKDINGDSTHVQFSINNVTVIYSFPVSVITTPITTNCNGTAYASTSLASGPYTYSWNQSPYGNNTNETGLCAGPHTLTVKNMNGDLTQVNFNIDSLTGPTFPSSDIVINQTPYVECNNIATVSVNNSIGPFTYSWDSGAYISDSVNKNLCSGYHTVMVKSINGAIGVSSIFIYTKTFMNTSPTYLNCLGQAEISFNSIDTTSFLFSWDNGSYTSSAKGDSLCLGIHTLNIIDGFGDTLIQNFEINMFDFYVSTHSTVNGCDGFASVFHSEAMADTTLYSWDGSTFDNFANSIPNLCEGIHTLSMTGAVLENDTLVFPFAIANAQNTYISNSTYGNDSISVFYDNCSIDYSLGIDSLNFTTFNYIDSFFVDFTVEIWQNGSITIMSDTILVPNFSLSELNVYFTFYCYQKSSSDVIKVFDVVTPTNTSTPTTPSTSIKEKVVNTISIYPNPTNNVLNIETGENLVFKIKIYDSRGQVVLQSNQKQIDVSLLAKGLYYLNYQSKNSFSTSKFIKK